MQGGPDYYSNIQSRLAGQGVGYGDAYASQAANPVIARMRSQFEGSDLPALQSELSAEGRRKGSAGFDQIARAYNQQGLDEGNVYSGLYQQNEQTKHSDVNDAFDRLGNYANNEANLQSQRSNFDVGDYQRQLGIAENQKQEGNSAFQRLIGVGTSFLPYGGGSGAASMIPQAANTYQNYSAQAPQYYYPTLKGGSSNYYNNVSTRLK